MSCTAPNLFTKLNLAGVYLHSSIVTTSITSTILLPKTGSPLIIILSTAFKSTSPNIASIHTLSS